MKRTLSSKDPRRMLSVPSRWCLKRLALPLVAAMELSLDKNSILQLLLLPRLMAADMVVTVVLLAAVPLHLPLVVRQTTPHSGLSTTGLRVCSRRQRTLSASRRLKLLPIRLLQPKQLPASNRRPLLPANLIIQHNGLNITGQLEK